MNLQKILAELKKRQGEIQTQRAKLNNEELRIWRIRNKIFDKLKKE